MRRFATILGLAALCLSSAFAATPVQTNGTPVQGNLMASDLEALPGPDQRNTPQYYRDVYTFQAQANETVDIRIQSDYDGYLLLFGPGGTLVASNDDFSSVRDSRIAMSLPQAGQYTLGVTSFSAMTPGNYTLTVQSLGVGAPVPADAMQGGGLTGMPPGFDISQMMQGLGGMQNQTPIVGTEIQGELTASDTAALPAGLQHSDPSYYRDVYPGPGTANHMMSIELNAQFDGYLYLLGPNGEVIASNDDAGDLNRSRIDDALLPVTGTYQVVVTSYSPGTTGSYTLTIGNPAPAPAQTADTPISIGQSVQGMLEAADNAPGPAGNSRSAMGYHRDGYSFQGTPGAAVAIDLTSSFDGYLILVGPGGTEIASNDDYTSTSTSRIQHTLSEAGTHRVIVTSYAERATGSYTLGLQTYVPAPTSADSAISFGSPVQGTLAQGDNAVLPPGESRGGPDYYRDGFTFTGQAGQALTVDAVYTMFDGYLFLLSPDGSVLSYNDDNTSTSDSRIVATPTQSGTHRIVVTSFSPNSGGSYTLTLTQGAAPPPPVTQTGPGGIQIQDVGGSVCQVEVRNDFNVPQFIFIDGAHIGTVAVGATQRFDIAPGTHAFVSADSANINDNPVGETFTISQGQIATYRIFVQYN